MLTHSLPESVVIPKLPIQGEARLDEARMFVAQCDEPWCIWKGGHVVEDYDPAFLHQALLLDEPGYAVEVNRASFEASWTVWANLVCDDGRTSSEEARAFTLALEIAEDMAAELNERAGK